jgi:hypothetical protein
MALLSPLDWAVLATYLVVIVGFGMYMGRGNQKLDDFFLAGRQMSWWAVGLSVMATQVSAITFVGTTGQAFTKGMSFLVVYFGLPIAMVILCVTLVPFFYRANVYTAYQYLEKRFDARTRTLTSLLFLLSRGLSVGITLYAPSLVLSVVFGWSESLTILLMASATIVYVVYGGNRSVIWTDVVQMILIWVGIFVAVGGSRSPSCRAGSGCATRWPWPRPRGGSRSWTPRSIPPAPTRCGAGSSEARSWPLRTSAPTRARSSATCRAGAFARAGCPCSSTRSSRSRCSS